jgi:hypothetical protein
MVRCAVAALLAIAAAAGAGACQGRKRDGDSVGGGARSAAASADAAAPSGSGAGSAGSGSGAAGSGAGSGSGKVASPDDPEAPADPNKQIADLGAIPAWQAVVDRAQLLARRGQKGVVYGRLGPAVALPAPSPDPADGGIALDAATVASPYVWLVDDTEGNGSLGIRLALGKLEAEAGDRTAASGAWELDAERRWYWKAEALQPLSPPPSPATSSSPPADPPSPAPSHVPATGGFPPNVRPIKQAKDNDAVYFQLAGPLPARDGDGWLIAGQLGDLPLALLTLPGERPSYGGQDLRSPDERWQLKRQQTYWVRIGKIRPQGAGKPFLVNARTAPIRVM